MNLSDFAEIDRFKREVSMDGDLFKPEGGIKIEPDEVLTTLILPLLQPVSWFFIFAIFKIIANANG